MNKIHGMCNTPTYRSWINARKRCFDTQHEKYADYGGRGITMCERWKNSFANFFADMWERPNGHQLDRINNNRGYEPGNCRWANLFQQAQNKRTNALLTLGGKTMCIAEWSRTLNIPVPTLANRLRAGWSIERTLTEGRHNTVRKSVLQMRTK